MSTRFHAPIRYSRPGRLMALLGMGPGSSRITVDDRDLTVLMGWAFRMTAPLACVARAAPGPRRVISQGVHFWRGRWLVNGAGTGLVTVGFDPPATTRFAGIPMRVRELTVSVDDAAGLIAALGRAPAV